MRPGSIVFSSKMSVHMRNSSQLTKGKVIEAAEVFFFLFFYGIAFSWPDSEPRWKTEGTS